MPVAGPEQNGFQGRALGSFRSLGYLMCGQRKQKALSKHVLPLYCEFLAVLWGQGSEESHR